MASIFDNIGNWVNSFFDGNSGGAQTPPKPAVTSWTQNTPNYPSGSGVLYDPNTQIRSVVDPYTNKIVGSYGPNSSQNLIQSGGSGGGQPAQQQGPSVPSREDQVRGDINGAYNGYFQQLDSMFSGLNDQAGAQNQIVENTTNQGKSDLTAANDQNQNIINNQRTKTESNRTKNLQDVSDNIGNMFQAGNVFLGAKGAADSSASNQYAYALTKLGTKQRGDINMNTDNILNDINTRETNLRTVYTQELSKLETTRQNQLLQVGQWLADAQNQIKQARANGELSKGKDLASLSTQLLNYAMQSASQIQAYNLSQRQQLDSWAQNTSTQINNDKQQMGTIGNVAYNLPQAQQINGAPQVDSGGNFSVAPVGLGTSTTEKDKNNIFALA
jgi:hypothetical protein